LADIRADWLFYGAVAAIALGSGSSTRSPRHRTSPGHGGVYDARTPLLWEMTSIAVIILLAPMLFRRGAADAPRHGWKLRIGLAVAAIVVFSPCTLPEWSAFASLRCSRSAVPTTSLFDRDADLRIPQGRDHLLY